MALPYQETMDQLQKMFQNLDRDTIANVLLNNNGLIDPSVEQLLKLTEVPLDPLADQKMMIFTMENSPTHPENPAKKEPKTNEIINEEADFSLVKQLQENEDEKIAMSLQSHYISKANNEAIQRIYEKDAEIEKAYMDAQILADPDSEDDDAESSNTNSQIRDQNAKKPRPEDFGPIPKPLPQKRTFKEKFSALFSRKKKENAMGKIDSKKLKDQEFGEIISFGPQENPPKPPKK